jgi:hypothetical protein
VFTNDEAPKDASKDRTEFAIAVLSSLSIFSLPQKRMSFIGPSTPMSPSTEPNPHRSGLPTVCPRRHHRKEKDHHLHIEDRYKSKGLSVVTQKSQN